MQTLDFSKVQIYRESNMLPFLVITVINNSIVDHTFVVNHHQDDIYNLHIALDNSRELMNMLYNVNLKKSCIHISSENIARNEMSAIMTSLDDTKDRIDTILWKKKEDAYDEYKNADELYAMDKFDRDSDSEYSFDGSNNQEKVFIVIRNGIKSYYDYDGNKYILDQNNNYVLDPNGETLEEYLNKGPTDVEAELTAAHVKREAGEPDDADDDADDDVTTVVDADDNDAKSGESDNNDEDNGSNGNNGSDDNNDSSGEEHQCTCQKNNYYQITESDNVFLYAMTYPFVCLYYFLRFYYEKLVGMKHD
jgi:hypothetical protein